MATCFCGLNSTFEVEWIIRITGNTIRNNKVAILTENNSTSFLNIGGNDIFNPGPINFPSSLFNVGIWVNEPNLSTSFIGRNRITSRYYGIHSFGGPVLNERIWQNRVELVRNLDGSGTSVSNFGIVVRDRNTPILISNYVKGVGISQQFSSASRVRGITLENNDNPIAHCNEMDNTYTGMIAQGDNTTADLQRNIMRPAEVGFLFKDNGQTGPQGSLTQTNDNEWHCQFTTSALRAENSFFANLSPFFVQSAINPFDPGLCSVVVSSDNTLPGGGNGQMFWPRVDAAISNSDPSPVVCDPFYWLRTAESDSSSENNEREVFDPVYGPDTFATDITAWYYLVATDSLNFEKYPEYLRLASRLNLYRKLTRMESLRDSDSLFHAFYTSAHLSSERFISNLLDATGNHEVEDGRNILSSWTPSNSTEEVWWNWFEISFRLMENASDTLSSGLKDTIIDYAGMCPDALGYPVHAARTVLMRIGLDSMISINECENWIYSDEVDSLDTDSWDSENALLLIYPNPASVTVNFEHDLEETENTRIKVYDAMGNIKYDELFYETSRTLTWDTSSEISGLYYVVLIQNENVVESKSLAIIH